MRSVTRGSGGHSIRVDLHYFLLTLWRRFFSVSRLVNNSSSESRKYKVGESFEVC